MRRIAIAAAFSVVLWAAEPAVDSAKKQLAAKKYDEAISTLDAAYKTKPKSAELQKALAEAYLAKADSFMYNDALPPFQKYPTALRSYRKVLDYDKENKKAKQSIATIEGIYKSMGRPVPQ
jgi:tetratricopeptide (TPR) repeat protein